MDQRKIDELERKELDRKVNFLNDCWKKWNSERQSEHNRQDERNIAEFFDVNRKHYGDFYPVRTPVDFYPETEAIKMMARFKILKNEWDTCIKLARNNTITFTNTLDEMKSATDDELLKLIRCGVMYYPEDGVFILHLLGETLKPAKPAQEVKILSEGWNKWIERREDKKSPFSYLNSRWETKAVDGKKHQIEWVSENLIRIIGPRYIAEVHPDDFCLMLDVYFDNPEIVK